MSEINDWTGVVHQGHSIEVMKEMPESSVHTVIFSPPYFSLRDYGEETETIWGGDEDCDHEWETTETPSQGGHNTDENPPDVRGNEHTQGTRLRGQGGIESELCSKCGAWEGQLGLEPSHHLYVRNMVSLGREIRRVLREDGSWWLNLGDTYAGGGGSKGVPDDWESKSTDRGNELYPGEPPARNSSLPDKCKMFIPHRVAIALVEDGWISRNDAIWKKTNPMPESATDRLSTTFEFVFHFVQKEEYYYDLDSIREPYSDSSMERKGYGFSEHSAGDSQSQVPGEKREPEELKIDGDNAFNESGKNPGDVFETSTASYEDAHFAVYPRDVIEPPIKATCPWKVCSECQTPYERDVERESGEIDRSDRSEEMGGPRARYQASGNWVKRPISEFKGWEKTCDCETDGTEPGVVLDPFMGSGTTAVVAEELDRRWVGIDLNPEYVNMSEDRISEETIRTEDYETPLKEW